MSMKLFSFLIFLKTISVSIQNPDIIDYCSPSLCSGRSKVHTACPGVAANNCPSDAQQVDMKYYQQFILQDINRYRNDIASGRNKNLPVASRLSEVRWDDELSKLAKLHAGQCSFENDQCRSTSEYPHAGQTVYASIGKGDATKGVRAAVDSWWDEYKAVTEADIKSFSESRTNLIGNFTVVANENSVRIGCGAVQSNNKTNFHMTCNYSYKNIPGRQVYSIGPAKSKCMLKDTKLYPALCNKAEAIEYKLPKIK